VLANLLAAPAAPVATLIGLAACLAAPMPVVRDGLAALAWLPASWIASTAETVTTLPGGTLPWPEGWPGAALLAVVGVAVGVVIAVRSHGAGRERLVRGVAIIVVAVTAGAGGGLSALGSVAGRWTLPQDWSVLACDVGQGDAVLLRSAGAVMLVDTGPAAAPLAACLARVGIVHIDVLVLTHFDLDHVGGAAAVTGMVGTVLHGPAYGDGDGILAVLRSGGARVVPAHAGMNGTVGRAGWRVLWPRAESPGYPFGNDASVVVDVRGGGVPPTLLLGDLSASPQRALAASAALQPPYAVVKVAHHGSADQDAGLYRQVAPTIAIVTVGIDNDYGHPRDEAMAIFAELGARVMRTDLEGVVAVSPAVGGWELWRERGSRVGAGG
jgi:competence protein ComEC